MIGDPNQQRYNMVRDNVIKLFMDYDKSVRQKHEALIIAADHMTKGTPMKFPKQREDQPIDNYRYITYPFFRMSVDNITSYIMNETYKENYIKEKFNDLAFDINTVKWQSHSKHNSDYDKGWNDALDRARREMLSILQKKGV